MQPVNSLSHHHHHLPTPAAWGSLPWLNRRVFVVFYTVECTPTTTTFRGSGTAFEAVSKTIVTWCSTLLLLLQQRLRAIAPHPVHFLLAEAKRVQLLPHTVGHHELQSATQSVTLTLCASSTLQHLLAFAVQQQQQLQQPWPARRCACESRAST